MTKNEILFGLAESYALKFLRYGRVGWDEPHTRSVVYHAEDVGRFEGLDTTVQKLVGWLHDLGYFNLFQGDSDKFEVVKDRKELHMIKGAEFAAAFLGQPEISGLVTPQQADRVVHIVRVHDKIEELREMDEIAFMEADTLGAIDISRVTPTFDYASGMKYLFAELRERRELAFRTARGKELLASLLPAFIGYFEALKANS
ncbi:MAG: HD domain-containing protein [bacterium]|nr:HD domain-containing protein [bacterium]